MSPAAETIWRHLGRVVAKGHSPDRVFTDWLDLALYAFQRRDPEYLEIVRRYPNAAPQGEREIDRFADALAELMRQLQAGAYDPLGEIYTEQITRGENGQFFTPEAVVELMARITVGEPSDAPERICDPACGSGRMLLSSVRLRPQGFFVGIDLDARCARMAALNLLFRNVDALVIQGDTLRVEVFRAWELRRTPLGGAISECPPAQLEQLKEVIVAARTQPTARQMSLF